MSEKPEDRMFNTSEELLQYLREHSDDIEGVTIPVLEGVDFVNQRDGQRIRRTNVGAIVEVVSGRSFVISREDAEMLINDGVLQRMRIKCVLSPLPKQT